MTWEAIAKSKREALVSKIPADWVLNTLPSAEDEPNVCNYLAKILPQEETAIANLTIAELSSQIASGKLSSHRVTSVFCKRASFVHQLTNCCSEIFIDRALARALKLDDYLKKNGKPIGPLHGIPISLKDQVNLEGIDTAIGYVSLVNKPVKKEDVSNIATILEDLGAVFYVKTTTPTAMMSGETVSNLLGPTLNSCNRKISCGGSSGGEGALVGGRGSLLGLGTDIGGSIRLPSNAQGLFGLRCSTGRIPYCKITNSNAHQPVIRSVVGPMATDLNDLKLFTKAIINTEPWKNDPLCPHIPWREFEIKGKLSYGVLDLTKGHYLHPPIKRALRMTRNALTSDGHEVLDIASPIPLFEMLDLCMRILRADGGKEIIAECEKSGEPVRNEVLVRNDDGSLSDERTITEFWDDAGLRYEYQQIFDKFWQSTVSLTSTGRPIDGFLLPLHATTGYKVGDFRRLGTFFTPIFNLLDYSVVAMPITKADKEVDIIETLYKPLNELDEICYKYYDPELFDGTPVGLQVIAPRYEEERAIFLTEIAEKALKKQAS
ncbi:uncharacterized protein PRCAT00005081001 [Priceomyces carsonii]|uniref:uncharacterized protein n=1 Tax=Priceomyces carsonii TaxID=28549 RepID=UPI002EDAEFEB|nr:unnamed protein product [Priceomyces carsonii]